MELLLSAAEKFFEFVALSMYLFFWCAVAGVACWILSLVFKTIRQAIEEKREAELLDQWEQRNRMIAEAVTDLDSPDPLQRALAEQFIEVICHIDRFPYGNSEADSHLIAAAPELLEALKGVLINPAIQGTHYAARIEALIKKAKGEN